MGQQEILTPLHNRNINVEFYYSLMLQSSFRMKGRIMKIKLGNTTRYEGVKFSSRKHKKTNNYYLRERKGKMKNIRRRIEEYEVWSPRKHILLKLLKFILICKPGYIGILTIVIHFSITGGCKR